MSGTASGVPLLDERGRRCPVPVVALARALRAHPAGTVVDLLADDPAADADVPAWCRLRGAQLLGVRPAVGGGTAYRVLLPGPPGGPVPPLPDPPPGG